jgi:hypothetical protein
MFLIHNVSSHIFSVTDIPWIRLLQRYYTTIMVKFSLLLFVSSFLGVTIQAQQPVLDCSLVDAPRSLNSAGTVTLRQVVNQVDGTVTMEMAYAGVKTWLGFAFSSTHRMVGSTAVVGLPGGSVALYNMGGYDVSAVTRLPDTQQTLQNTAISTNGTHTVMIWTQRLNELAVSLTNPNGAIFGVGFQGDTTLGLHASKNTFDLSLTTQCREITSAKSPTSAPIPATVSTRAPASAATSPSAPAPATIPTRVPTRRPTTARNSTNVRSRAPTHSPASATAATPVGGSTHGSGVEDDESDGDE